MNRSSSSRRGNGSDFYALLGLAPRFAVDAAVLERAYLEKSREVHPDRFVSAPARERVSALERSMAVNQAYKTLKKPLPRAEYLLARHGVDVDSAGDVPPAVLMDVMEWHEDLGQAKAARDAGRLRALVDDMRARARSIEEAVGEHFSGFEAGGDRARLHAARDQVILWRYVRRCLDNAEEAADELLEDLADSAPRPPSPS